MSKQVMKKLEGKVARMANYTNGWICVICDSLDQVKSYIDNIRNECSKAKRDPIDIHITAILYSWNYSMCT